MGRIVAIGGGELRYLETLAIDKYIVSLTNKTNPKALFIPTASHEAPRYVEAFNKVYGDIGCITDTLYLLNNEVTEEEIKTKILSADLIYVGGGDTLFMLETWKSKKVDIYLKQAYENNIILSGLSAGSICWFEYGHSDSNIIRDNNGEYIIINGLGLIKGIHCPHYNDENRSKDFNNKMKDLNLIGIALEDNCALEILDNRFRIIKADNHYKAYRFINDNGTLIKDELTENENYYPLEQLYNL